MIRFHYIILSILLSLMMGCPLYAQITIGYDEFGLEGSLKTVIVESDTNNPIAGVALYLTSPEDSTIVALAFSDKDGKVVIDQVMAGTYDIYAEMLGYKPFHISRQIDGVVDLGVTKLDIDTRTIDPASIEAYVKPMEVKKDTIIYYAAAFPVMENDVLEDLIRKMPGLSVDEKGVVSANGRSVEQITVGGRTFFFDDPSLVIKSLPARVVEKILVIDKETRDSEFSGLVSVNSQEKVMDIRLKDEFMQALFGRVSLDAGVSVPGQDVEALNSAEKALFNTNAMASYGTDNDQLTVITIGNNDGVNKGGMAVGTNDMDDFDNRNGLTSAVKTGANFNTLRIKGMESNASLSYYYDKKDVIERNNTDIMIDDNRSSLSRRMYDGTGDNRMISGNVNLMNVNTAKYSFKLTPTISFSKKNRAIMHLSEDGNNNSFRDMTESTITSSTLSEGIRVSAGVKEIGGKRSRTLNFTGNMSHHLTDGDESRYHSSSTEQLALQLGTRSARSMLSGQLTYSEPLNDNWTIQGMMTVNRQSYQKRVDAEDINTHEANAYYTSNLDETDAVFGGRLLAQYRKGPMYWTFGPILEWSDKQMESVTFGNICDTRNTKTNWSPYMNFGWSDGLRSLSAEYDGRTLLPTKDLMLPTIDMTNQVTGMVGNIYLLPSYVHSIFPTLSIYTEKNLMLFVSSGIIVTTRPTTRANWMDMDGNVYFMPVNSLTPQSSFSLSADLSDTFGKEMNWSLDMSVSSSYATTSSYQAQNALPSLDVAHLDYTSVMSSIWGDSSGDAFYGGSSGFRENHVKEYMNSASASLAYRDLKWSARIGGSVDNTIYSYSLLSSRLDWWRFNILGSFTWNTRLFQTEMDLKHMFYSGYERNMPHPEFVVNLGVSKDIKGLSLSLKANDIFNQHQSYSRSVGGNILLDQYSNVLGRNVMVGIAFHFGTPSRKSSSKANEAVQNIVNY